MRHAEPNYEILMFMICEKTGIQEYKEAENQPDYRHFLEGKFKDVFEKL
ncbi:hypothetical protein [Butyrivibrio sp. YAB3001]|nr:hypothetical protein [Butyrivibrio sp. YAB3001]SFD04426.1 hypothetical protein SAMN02910398_03874 [Butyrivibrio sp. YAB3001]